MFITDFENHVAAKKIILTELRRITGSKVKDKVLQSVKQYEEKPASQQCIFGSSVSSSKKICVENEFVTIKVPTFLHMAVEYLEQKIQTEFLLRKGGSAGRQRLIRKEIENVDSLDSYGTHDIACLLKQWLRELKEPLIPLHLQELFLKCNACGNSEQSLLLACLLLPLDHLTSLRYLLIFLNKVATKSKQNKMDACNISVVMAPNIMPCSDKNGKLTKEVDRQLQERRDVMTSLMKVAGKIGFFTDNLQEKLFATDCHMLKSSEDELEKSGNSLHASSLSINKRRKKRKSIMSEWRKKLVGANLSTASSKENINKLHLTPGPKRKADSELAVISNKKRLNSGDNDPRGNSTPKQPKKEFQLFTPNNARPTIQFTNTPVSEMNFSSISSKEDTPRRRRGSSRSGKSGCFKTPKSRAKNRRATKEDSLVASRLAGEVDNLSVIEMDTTPCPAKTSDTMTYEEQISDTTDRSPMPDDSNDYCTPPKIAKLDDEGSAEQESPRRRSQRIVQKTGSIVRGRPNTIRSGLPSPFRQVTSFRTSFADDSLDNSDAVEKAEVGSCSGSETVERTDFCSNFESAVTLREKSVSTPDLTNERRRSLRKIASIGQLKSHTGATFAPLSKDTAEILKNIGEMVTPVGPDKTTTTPEDVSEIKWISGDKFFKNVIRSPDLATKRESVLRIERDNAGNVRANVSKFNDITNAENPKPEFKTPIGIVPRTPRRRSKRGAKTPVRIPSVFVRSSGVTNSIRNRYKNLEPNRRASLRIAPTMPLTTFVKHTSNGMGPKRRHSAVYRSSSYMAAAAKKSPLRDSNIVNIRVPMQKD